MTDSQDSSSSLTDVENEDNEVLNDEEVDDDEENRQYTARDNADDEFVLFSARIPLKENTPPSDLQATHVNHYHDLERVHEKSKDFSLTRPSTNWLASNGLPALNLTLKDLLDKGQISRPVGDKTGRAVQHITFDALTINDFECRLHTAIETLSNRIKWLLQNSRKIFGVVQGSKTLVVLDFSQSNASFGRGEEYRKNLLQLIDEQLSKKQQLGFLAYGTEVDALWKGLRDVNARSLDELRMWIAALHDSFGCSENCTHMETTCDRSTGKKCAFKSNGGTLRRVEMISDYDTLLLIVGSLPDQNIDIIADFTAQIITGLDKPRLHAVSYDCNHHLVSSLLKTITSPAEKSAIVKPTNLTTTNNTSLTQIENNDLLEARHTYHCYSRDEPHQIYASTDIRLLVQEIQRAHELLQRINEMRRGALGSALISIENELTLEIARYPQSKFLPRPPNHEQALRFPQSYITASPILYSKQRGSSGHSNSGSGKQYQSPTRERSNERQAKSVVRFNDSVSVAEIQSTAETTTRRRSHASTISQFSSHKSVATTVKQRKQIAQMPAMPSNNPVIYRTSADWLRQHGLLAKKLTLFQVLAPNAYSTCEDFIPILGKTVQSQVLERAMVPVDWHDGTVKNVHVDLSGLYEYQKRLKAIVELYEHRIEWLCSSSRKIFGTIVENNVILLVDCSLANRDYIIHIQHSLRILLEQQMFGRSFFNIIAFGCDYEDRKQTNRSGFIRYKPTMVQPTIENLQNAWEWVLKLNCTGTRNLLCALRSIYENEEERKHGLYPDGIYLLTSGVPDQPLDVCCAYVEESNVGKSISLHTILFNIDDYIETSNNLESTCFPGRWATATKTAEFMRALAKCSGGRFLWFRETGIIESDDLKLLQNEIEKACQYSEQAANLVDIIKSKRRLKNDNNNSIEQKSNDDDVAKKFSNGPLVVRQTALSAARQQLHDNNIGNEDNMKILPWRPTNTTNRSLIPEWPDENYRLKEENSFNSTPNPKRNKSRSDILSSKQESFYVDGQTNAKFSIMKNDSTASSTSNTKKSKSVRKYCPSNLLLIPSSDENETTHSWLRKYSLARLKLDLHKMVSGPECRHDTIAVPNIKLTSSARYCAVFPSINLKGSIRHLQLRPRELDDYRQRCEYVLKRYFKRMQWLLSGSRLTFSTIVHKKILFLIDTSGSMETCIDHLKKELAALIWDQFYSEQIEFNLIQFSDNYQQWRDGGLLLATEENCHDAVAWISTLKPSGNTCTDRVLKYVFEFNNQFPIEAIYYVSDGKPDHSTSYVLEQVKLMNTIPKSVSINENNTLTNTKKISINTISFNCQDVAANNFLKTLAHENNGRYHRLTINSRDVHLFIHRLQQDKTYDLEMDSSLLPELDGDDLKRLLKEMEKARLFLKQAITFRSLYDQQQLQNENTLTSSRNEDLIVGPARVPSDACFTKKSSTTNLQSSFKN